MTFNAKLSLYITRILNPIYLSSNRRPITETLLQVFHKKNIGHIERVDVVPIKGCQIYSQSFIHFNHWYCTQEAFTLQKNIIDNDNNKYMLGTKFIYDNPHYWIIRPNTYRWARKKDQSIL